MRINQVSFGKIVKVYAPYEYAKQIEKIANGKKLSKNKKLNEDVNNLFNDVNKGDAHTFYYDKKISYILSGEEGQKYWKSRSDSIKNMHEIRDNMRDSVIAKNRMEKVWTSHRKNVFDMIKNYGISKSVEPTIKKGKIKILDCNI